MVVINQGFGGDVDVTFDTNETVLTQLQIAYYDTINGWSAAQGTDLLSAEALVVDTGKAMSNGVYEIKAHGLIVGMEYVSDPNNLGAVIPRTSLLVGEPYQKIFSVPNANQIDIDVQPLIDTADSAALVREDFPAALGGEPSVNVVTPIPVNVSLEVYRSNVLAIEGLLNDYTKAGQTITFTPALTAGEMVTVLWLERANNIYRDDLTVGVGDTNIPVNINNGQLPVDSTNVLLFRQNVLLIEGVDYNVVGNVITLLTPAVASDGFTLIIYT